MRDHESVGADIAHWAECQLATVEAMRSVKRTAKYDMARQESIAAFAVGCAALYSTPDQIKHAGPRLGRAVQARADRLRADGLLP